MPDFKSMPDFKGMAKGVKERNPLSNHDGKPREGLREKGKKQISGFIGRGKDSASEREEHVSRPLATLKDPSAFGPPPKHINYHGAAAMPNQSTPDTRGLGAPLSREQVQAKQREEEEEARREAEESSKPPPPPRPFRIDTTGLSTSHLPPPPGRKDGADGRSPTMSPPPVVARSKPPGLPPRLPPRQNSNPAPSPPPTYTSEPPAHRGMLNQGSLNRLGASGISVPGFGIGNSTSSPSKETPSPGGHSSQLNELQSRFSRLSPSRSESPVEGTTFAQKQAALKTASSFRNDPSSVSLSDARSAASTANNFRERHGEQVKSGWQSANSLNSKYGISDKVGMYSGLRDSHEPEEAYTPIEMKDNTASSPEPVIAAKKKPPPPPVKRAGLSSPTVGRDGGPPPIPLSSKPKPPAGGYS